MANLDEKNTDQAASWNGNSGRVWTERQAFMDRLLAPVSEALFASLDITPGMRAIDIGCGTGGTTLALAQRIGPEGHALGLDISAPMLARAVLTAAFLTTPYVRAGGLGSRLAAAPHRACVVALLLAVVFCLLLPGWRAVVGAAVAVLVFVLWRRACLQRLGGMTGDTCGALTELVEAAVLIVCVCVG